MKKAGCVTAFVANNWSRRERFQHGHRKKPRVQGEHERLGRGESQGATGLRAGAMRPAALRSRRDGRMASKSLRDAGNRALPGPRLVPNTTVRSRRISRLANDSWLCMVLHQDRSPAAAEGDRMRTAAQRINSPLR